MRWYGGENNRNKLYMCMKMLTKSNQWKEKSRFILWWNWVPIWHYVTFCKWIIWIIWNKKTIVIKDVVVFILITNVLNSFYLFAYLLIDFFKIRFSYVGQVDSKKRSTCLCLQRVRIKSVYTNMKFTFLKW